MRNQKYEYFDYNYYLNDFDAFDNFSLITVSKVRLKSLNWNKVTVTNFEDIENMVKNAEDIYSVVFIKKTLLKKFFDDIYVIFDKIKYDNHFIYLLEYINPPKIGHHIGMDVENFVCSKIVFDQTKSNGFNNLCFFFSSNILNRNIVIQRIFVVQLGKKDKPFVSFNSDNCLSKDVSIMIPHLGELGYLEACLEQMENQLVAAKEINICFDDDSFKNFKPTTDLINKINLWKNSPQNVGPYYARDFIFKVIKCKYVIFQDSDDLATSDRVKVLMGEINRYPACGMIGSHYLDVDETENKIYSFRYPLNVNNAFLKYPKSYLLHPTTILSKKFYEISGGFTKWRKFASDAQFNLKAPLYMQIRNSDNFLYIKRTRRDSLLTASKSHLNSKLRKFFHRIWERDIELILNNKLDIDSSTFCETQLEPPINFSLIRIN